MVTLNKGERVVVIIGLPGCGKTTLSKEMAKAYPSYTVIHTDQYSQLGGYGADEALTKLAQDVLACSGGVIIDGCLAYRLLRSGKENNFFRPDLIIEVVATSTIREQRRQDKDYSQLDRIYRKVWSDYVALENDLPRLITIDTTQY